MNYTKQELYTLAEEICIPLINRTAKRLSKGEISYKVDRAGFACSMLENICRGFMGAACVEQIKEVKVFDGLNETTLLEWWSSTLIAGCDDQNALSFERGRKSLGDNFFYNQSITEICCMLVFSYFVKEKFWDKLATDKKDLLLNKMLVWAERALEDSWQNNHLWFPILSLVVLKKLGYKAKEYEQNIEKALRILDTMYIGEGWYQDGEFGRFDYYVGWSLHLYPLWWSVLEDEDFPGYTMRKKEYIKRTEQFLPHYMHWFDAQGANVAFGRSLSYRFAAVALIPTAVLAGCKFDFGSAKKLMFDNIGFYMKNIQMPSDGIIPPGIFCENQGFVESYTSDGGAFWCAKSFCALFIPDEHKFWTTPISDYPAQKKEYFVYPDNKRVHMGFANTSNSGVTLYNNTANYKQNNNFLHPFNDMASYYSKFAYNTKSGFAISCRDLVAFDNMISLKTPDNVMQSHRLGFVDLGMEKDVLYSKHQPFSNDDETKIYTAILPIKGSMHVRIHKVVLGRQYIVREGGFSVPFYEDNFSMQKASNNGIKICTPNFVSIQNHWSNVKTQQYMEMPKPGNHTYAPMCGYPAYETQVLSEGIYWFASAYSISDDLYQTLDEIIVRLSDNKVTISYQNMKHIVDFNFNDLYNDEVAR